METNGEQNTKPPACELVQGFERRILFKTVSSGAIYMYKNDVSIFLVCKKTKYNTVFEPAGVCGIAVGTLLAFRRPASSSILKSSLTSAASLSILSLAFSGTIECDLHGHICV